MRTFEPPRRQPRAIGGRIDCAGSVAGPTHAPQTDAVRPLAAIPARTDDYFVRRLSGSRIAAGGIAIGSRTDPEEAQARHVADTVRDGAATRAGVTADAPPTRASKPDAAVRSVLSDGFGLGEGRPLDAGAKLALTPHFRDLAAIRVHDDATAARAARSVGARAFALGNDLVFSEGVFDPHTATGRGLLAHEVAHVAQGGSVLRRQPLDEFEKENEQIAPALRPRNLLSLDYSGPDVCGGGRCFSDDEIYGPLERSRADDRLAEARATDRRMTIATIDMALVELVNREQRGTREHRYARERLEAFRTTGQLLRPRVNIDGGAGALNMGAAVMAPMALACAAFPVACGVVGAWIGGLSVGEVITGRSSGFLNPGRLLSGDTEIGRDLSVGERVLSGFNALLSLFGIGAAAWAARSAGALRFVGPVFQYAERDIIIVETSLGRQAFYRSTGQNSGMPGRWLPFDEVTNMPPQLRDWFNKAGYTEGIPVGAPLHRLGTPEFVRISDALTEMNIGTGAPLLSARHVNDILDFYGARLTQYSMQRPGLE